MNTTTIRTTCDGCHLTFVVPVGAIVLELPAPTEASFGEPSFVRRCPGCRACDSTTVPWRTATYLVDAGATVLTAPELALMQPPYPECRPSSPTRMSLDDLIDLYASLDSDVRAL